MTKFEVDHHLLLVTQPAPPSFLLSKLGSIVMEVDYLLMQQPALSSFSPEILPHVCCHVGFSLVISSFYVSLKMDAASVDLNVELSEKNEPH